MNDNIRKLNDNELDMISGGRYIDDAQAEGKCPYCAVMLKKTGNHFECPECGTRFDRDGKEI